MPLPLLFRPYLAPPGFGVITCFFNPNGYRSKLRNYRLFRASLERSGIPCLTTECVFPGRTPELTGWPDVLTVTSPDSMWQKERLLNVAIARLPDTWTTVAWLDCDVLFEDPCWAVHAVEQVAEEAVVQLFSEVVRLPQGETWGRQGDERWDSFAAVCKRAPNQLLKGDFARHGHTGFGWAAQRSLLTRHGLYDGCIAGSGDHMMSHAFAGDWAGGCIERIFGTNNPHRRHFSHWAESVYRDVRARVSFVPGTLFHLWHGDTANRRYVLRNRELAFFEFDPLTDIRVNSSGCWEWASDKPDLHAWAAQYFANRKEDGDPLLRAASLDRPDSTHSVSEL